MATKMICDIFRSFLCGIFQSPDGSTIDNTSEICSILDLPFEILQIIIQYLNIRDIILLSQTCRTFYKFINNDNFWIDRVRCQFPQCISQFYTIDLFEKPEKIEIDYKIRSLRIDHVGSFSDLVKLNSELDRLAVHSVTYYNDEATERRHAKMYISKKDFLNNVQYFQYNKPIKSLRIPFMKLIYFYLIDRKRTAAIKMDMFNPDDYHRFQQIDRDSLTGTIICLQGMYHLVISGSFEYKIMPGKYEVIWRMKCNPEDMYMNSETEFIVVPSHGKMITHKIYDHDFQNYVLEHGNQWFLVHMGQIIIYKLSKVLVGIRNWDSSYKQGISFDYIELKLIE